MKIRSLLLLSCLTVTCSVAQEVRIDTRLQPDNSIRAGQPVQYEIDVLTDTWLIGTPDFNAFEVPGMLVTFEGSQGRTIQRTIDGKRYFGVTFAYRLIPLEPGVRTLPALHIDVPIGQAEKPIAAGIPARTFAVQPLPAVEAADIRLLAGEVSLSQRLQPDTASIRVGQPLIREIHIEAHQALALSIPAPEAAATASLTGMRLPPEVRSLTDPRGRVRGGERIERVRYLPEAAGTLSLPALALTWWDINEGKMKHSELPGLEIEVMAWQSSPSEHLILSGQPLLNRIDRHFPGGWQGLILALGLTFWAAWRFRRALWTTARSCYRRLRQRGYDTFIGARYRAIRGCGKNPPELTATYRLIKTHYGSTSIRNAPLSPSSRQDVLEGMSHYYSPTPDPTRARRTLVKALRRLAHREHREHREHR